MTDRIEEHAAKVVARFKEMLSNEQIDAIGDEHFQELEMLIEAAIGSGESQALSDAVKEVEALARSLTRHVATIRNLEKE